MASKNLLEDVFRDTTVGVHPDDPALQLPLAGETVTITPDTHPGQVTIYRERGPGDLRVDTTSADSARRLVEDARVVRETSVLHTPGWVRAFQQPTQERDNNVRN